MRWDLIKPGLLALIQSISELPANGIVWKDKSRPFVDTAIRAILLLSVKNSGASGWDDVEIEYDANQPQGQELVDLLTGIRNFTLTIQCDSYEQQDSKTAEWYLEQIRQRLSRRSAGLALNAFDCAYYGDGPVVSLDRVENNRKVSVGFVDLMLRARVSEPDTFRYGYIETVDIEPNVGLPVPLINLGSSAAVFIGVP